MKILICLFLLALGGEGRIPEEGITMNNLRIAYQEESDDAVRYELYSRQAAGEGYADAERLFHAMSLAEEIHVRNIAHALEELGGKAEPVAVKPVKVATTKKNIKAAIRKEARDSKYTYLMAAYQAKEYNILPAKEAFVYAKNGAAAHHHLLEEVLHGLGKNPEVEYYVSQKTGEVVAGPHDSMPPHSLYEDEVYVKADALP